MNDVSDDEAGDRELLLRFGRWLAGAAVSFAIVVAAKAVAMTLWR